MTYNLLSDPVPPHSPVITWEDKSYNIISKGSTLLQTDGRYEISGDGRVLTIKNVQEQDLGMYHCLASNSHETSDKMPIELKVYCKSVSVCACLSCLLNSFIKMG